MTRGLLLNNDVRLPWTRITPLLRSHSAQFRQLPHLASPRERQYRAPRQRVAERDSGNRDQIASQRPQGAADRNQQAGGERYASSLALNGPLTRASTGRFPRHFRRQDPEELESACIAPAARFVPSPAGSRPTDDRSGFCPPLSAFVPPKGGQCPSDPAALNGLRPFLSRPARGTAAPSEMLTRKEARSRSSRSCNRLPKLGVHGVDIGHGDLAAAGTTAARTTGRFVRLADIGPSIERAAGDEQARSPSPCPSTLQNRLYWPGQFPQLWGHAHLRPAHP